VDGQATRSAGLLLGAIYRTPKQTIGEVADVPGNGSRQLVVILLGDDEILELDDSFFDLALFAGPMEPPPME
jgi:hypothetical protein